MEKTITKKKKSEIDLNLSKWKPKLTFAKWKTIKGGSETRFLSEQIDDILYGE